MITGTHQRIDTVKKITNINAGNLTHGSLPTAEPLALVEHDDLIPEVTGIYIHAC
jgi:hypothetical protein